MLKKLSAYILVLFLGALAILVAAFGDFGGRPIITPTSETVTGEIRSFPPGFTGAEETTRGDISNLTLPPTSKAPATEPTDPPTDAPSDQSVTEDPSASVQPDSGSETDPGSQTSAPSDDPAKESGTDPSESGTPEVTDELETDSSAYCVIDDSGNIILSKNPYAHLQPASTLKVLTALVVAENVASLDEKVTVSERAVNDVAIMSSGVTPSLKPGESFTIRELLYALLLPSTNAAGNVLAEYVAGSESAFAELMNTKCRALGLQNSAFLNPHGLDRDGQYSCAYDMAMILRAAVQYSELRTILSAKDCTIPATEFAPARTMKSGHLILRGEIKNKGAFAGKSGWTIGANATLVTAYERSGQKIYVCTMNSDERMHFIDTVNLADRAYDKLKGTKTALAPLIHDLTVTRADSQGVTVTWSYGEGVVKGRTVLMNNAIGPSSALFTDLGQVSQGTREKTFEISEPGIYQIQVFGQNALGVEDICFGYVLFTGEGRPDSGVFTRQNHDYWVNRRGFILRGIIEAPSGVYYGDENNFILHYDSFVPSDGNVYLIGPQGKAVRGWQTINGKKYYLQADGRLATGRIIVEGVVRTFTADGVLNE